MRKTTPWLIKLEKDKYDLKRQVEDIDAEIEELEKQDLYIEAGDLLEDRERIKKRIKSLDRKIKAEIKKAEIKKAEIKKRNIYENKWDSRQPEIGGYDPELDEG